MYIGNQLPLIFDYLVGSDHTDAPYRSRCWHL